MEPSERSYGFLDAVRLRLFLNGKANHGSARFQQFASLEIHNCNLWHLGKELYYYPVYLLDLFFCYFTEKYLFILA